MEKVFLCLSATGKNIRDITIVDSFGFITDLVALVWLR